MFITKLKWMATSSFVTNIFLSTTCLWPKWIDLHRSNFTPNIHFQIRFDRWHDNIYENIWITVRYVTTIFNIRNQHRRCYIGEAGDLVSSFDRNLQVQLTFGPGAAKTLKVTLYPILGSKKSFNIFQIRVGSF